MTSEKVDDDDDDDDDNNNNNNNNNNNLSSVLTIVGSTFQLTPACHGGNPSLFYVHVGTFSLIFLLLNHLY